jgi:hypothetical protein
LLRAAKTTPTDTADPITYVVLFCAPLQLEEETFDSLDVFTFLGDPDHPNRPYPHFSKLAEAYGVPSVTAWTKQELLEGLSVMFSRPGPFLLEVVALAERPQIKYWDDSEQ